MKKTILAMVASAALGYLLGRKRVKVVQAKHYNPPPEEGIHPRRDISGGAP